MTVKTAAGAAFAAACLMSFAGMPGAKAQTSYAPQTYQGNSAYPGSAAGSYGSTMGNYGPQAQGNPNSTMGSYGSTTGYYTPQSYPGSASPDWSQGSAGSTTGTNAPQPSGAGLGNTDMANGPQGSPPDRAARQNVMQSERYDRLLESSRGFRQARMRRECGPITDQQLHQQCLDSFAQYEPAGASSTASGSSTSPRHYRSGYGR
jgi:hypothetical protein